MRNLFLALVLANFGFAAWSAWFAPEPSVGRSAADGLPRILLVSEVPPDLRSAGGLSQPAGEVAVAEVAEVEDVAEVADAADAVEPPAAVAESGATADASAIARTEPEPDQPAEPTAPPAVAAAPPPAGDSLIEVAARCTSVGPFRELSQAATAAAALRSAGYQPLQRVAEGDIWIGYWVYIPAVGAEQEANDILAKVRADGITDSYVIPNSDSGNLVSLGVFSEISGVSRRRDQVRALGFEPEVVDRTRRATVYWVDVTLRADQTLDFDALQSPGRIIRLEQRDCEPPAA